MIYSLNGERLFKSAVPTTNERLEEWSPSRVGFEFRNNLSV